MTDEQFEQLVSEGVDKIPERFLEQIDNVAILIADRPTAEQLKAQGMKPEESLELLGLYEGIPRTERGEYYGIGDAVLPDKITIFKEATIEDAKSMLAIDATQAKLDEAVREVVRDTVWHEVGHYFGWDDEELHSREDEGTNFSK